MYDVILAEVIKITELNERLKRPDEDGWGYYGLETHLKAINFGLNIYRLKWKLQVYYNGKRKRGRKYKMKVKDIC